MEIWIQFISGLVCGWSLHQLWLLSRGKIQTDINTDTLRRFQRLTSALESGELGDYRITTLQRNSDGSMTRKVYDPQLGELDTEDWGKDWSPEIDEDFE